MPLVLARSLGDEVVIGGGTSGIPEIRVKVTELDRVKVRLAFAAPPSVPIDRGEVRAAKVAAQVAGKPR